MSDQVDNQLHASSESGRLMRVQPMDAVLGASVQGVDLRALDSETFAAVHRAWLDHLVLLFRDQELTDEDLGAFSRRFGDLDHAPSGDRATVSEDIRKSLYLERVQDGLAIGSSDRAKRGHTT